jgi:hypothetical protein
MLLISQKEIERSTLILDYLYHNQDFPLGLIVSLSDQYQSYLPSIFLHDQYTPEILTQLIKRQHDVCYRSSTLDPRIFIVLDNCFNEAGQWMENNEIRTLFCNGQCMCVTVLLAMAHCRINPAIRGNLSYVFLCQESELKKQEQMFRYYGGIFPSFEMFKGALNQCAQNHGCMVIDNRSSSDRIEDQVFWYRPKIKETFKMCYPIFWNHPESLFTDEDRKKIEMYESVKKMGGQQCRDPHKNVNLTSRS